MTCLGNGLQVTVLIFNSAKMMAFYISGNRYCIANPHPFNKFGWRYITSYSYIIWHPAIVPINGNACQYRLSLH